MADGGTGSEPGVPPPVDGNGDRADDGSPTKRRPRRLLAGVMVGALVAGVGIGVGLVSGDDGDGNDDGESTGADNATTVSTRPAYIGAEVETPLGVFTIESVKAGPTLPRDCEPNPVLSQCVEIDPGFKGVEIRLVPPDPDLLSTDNLDALTPLRDAAPLVLDDQGVHRPVKLTSFEIIRTSPAANRLIWGFVVPEEAETVTFQLEGNDDIELRL